MIMLFLAQSACTKDTDEVIDEFNFIGVTVDNHEGGFSFQEVSLQPSIKLSFSTSVNELSAQEKIKLYGPSGQVAFDISYEDTDKSLIIVPQLQLQHFSKYELHVAASLVSHQNKELNSNLKIKLSTRIDSTYKFPEISDQELLTKIQEQTFKYFWDFGHPVSGLARERNTSGETVTSGGSGFGLMAILVGIERGFVTRTEGVERLGTIIRFLQNDADRFHGAWSHWLNGTTGKAIAFSAKDDGGDLVETSFMIAGLLTVKQYLNSGDATENELIKIIDELWHDVEWDWYTQGGQNALYWHWSENYGWDMNMKISGYNEALITYVLAASSPTHSIDSNVYHEGWAKNGDIKNGKTFYDYSLPLGYDYGGPLFFTHYSFMGLDPRNLTDTYANYWEQNEIHSKINRAHCINNPKNYFGYSSVNWGLTASDNHEGYSAHSPTNDKGVITPTAAISSIPYTPEESMEAIKFFYYVMGERLWGKYGFYDAFNASENWTASSYLAIDQGPIIVMIENYRTGLCWDLFMKNEDIQNGLRKLGFDY